MRAFRLFVLTLLTIATTSRSEAQSCGGAGQAPCAILEVLPLCYNLYRDETQIEYYPCHVKASTCNGNLVRNHDGICEQRRAAERGIRCCNDVVRPDGVVVGKKAIVDLTIASTVVPPMGVDYCHWSLSDRPNAVRTMDEWMSEYRALLAINANFFDASKDTGNPHFRACTRAYGPTVRTGSYVAAEAETTINGIVAWSFVKFTPAHAETVGYPADIMSSAEFPSKRLLSNIIEDAVTGVLLARGGEYNVALEGSPFKPKDRVPRVAIGITEDRKSLNIVVVQNGNRHDGMTLRELATYMIENTNSSIALNLDGGGSATMYFNEGTGKSRFITPPSDLLPGLSDITGSAYYRPFPVFIGFQ
jgi:hypothetical protein